MAKLKKKLPKVKQKNDSNTLQILINGEEVFQCQSDVDGSCDCCLAMLLAVISQDLLGEMDDDEAPGDITITD